MIHGMDTPFNYRLCFVPFLLRAPGSTTQDGFGTHVLGQRKSEIHLMARIEYIVYTPHRATIIGNSLKWESIKGGCVINGLPQIFWENGAPWHEVNLWARERAATRDVDLSTVQTNMRHLVSYATFLEVNGLDWQHFPARKEDRCLVKWRKKLIDDRGEGVSSVTVSHRMAATIMFYRYASANQLIDRTSQMWVDRSVVLNFFDKVGFERSMQVVSSDLAIPNKVRPGLRLEDGLLPISGTHMQQLLAFTSTNSSEELNLLLSLGFFTGGRIQTLAGLKVQTIERATQDPKAPGIWRIAVGPGMSPPVATKFGVDGHILIPEQLLRILKEYVYSVRRLKREAIASPENKDLVFLTRFGNSYCERNSSKSPSINREMCDLRRAAVKAGLFFMRDFHFHQTRATFGTWLMEMSLSVGDPISAIAFVRDAMLHKHESTTFKYIRFLKESKAKAEMANAFSEAFTGVSNLAKAPTHE